MSPDRALTAHCQLAAIRLKVQRAKIAFFDRKVQYVLAEATGTTELHDGTCSSEKPSDRLLDGIRVIPRGEDICSIALDPAAQPGHGAADAVSIINDLSKDERSKGLLPVTGEPHFRFYAGVPITSPLGHGIGRQ